MAQSASAGRSGSRWRRLTTELRAQHNPCWLCGQPIDYTLTWPHPRSFSTDHRIPLSEWPEGAEDPSNLAAACLECNISKGNRPPTRDLGTTSRTW